ncbi:hypothetical protein O2V63_05735 [Modestobacter sp. VKM Ac-2977]|uniref:hypothetical protein n=1 Tax=Modestobacter sp. VKM Ac-2977 TaxID=3004131 RepID=UPI0022AAF22C|nr:hypothetical protein [Modestobacter sp. VKM Ac-2977]MCZ2819822.1 hypothetical protein [Modestobacter sp. VKM Ac-2977]
MTAATHQPVSGQPATGRTDAGPGRRSGRQGVTAVLRSEWVKFAGMRATWLLLGASALLTVGLGLAAALALVHQVRQGEEVSTDTFRELPAMGLNFAHLFVGALAVLLVTVEWSSGSIRTTLGALDRRGPLLLAKAVVVSVTAGLVSLVSAVAVHLLSLPIVRPVDPALRFADAGSLFHIGGTVLFTGLVALIALGIGFLLRSTAGGIVTVVALLIVLPTVMALMPWDPVNELGRFLPLNAGNGLLTLSPPPGSLSHLVCLVTLLGWAGVAVALGAARLTRTDI